MKNKKIIIIANVIMITILVLIYFLVIKNKTYTTYTKDYDEYMVWKIKNEGKKVGEIYNTSIYIIELGSDAWDGTFYYLFDDNTYREVDCTSVHYSVRNGNYVLAKLEKNKNWRKFNIKQMYFAYDPWWGNDVELHIQTNDGKFYIIATYHYTYDEKCKEFYNNLLKNSNLDISNLKNDMNYWE